MSQPRPARRTRNAGSAPADTAGRPPRVIAVASGKGGVGKTTVSINLALALCKAGQRTLLLDADLALANVDVMLGLRPRASLADVLAGDCRISDVVLEGPRGLQVIPTASGHPGMSALTPQQQAALVHVLSELEDTPDVVVVDTAAGIAESVLTFCQAAHEVVVVVCDEPASITDAYALVKVLNQRRGIKRVQVLANQVPDAEAGRQLFERLEAACARYLDVSLSWLGAIPRDEWLRLAVSRQQAVVDAFPSAPSAVAFDEVARRIGLWQPPRAPRGHIEFFLEQLVRHTRSTAA